MRGYVTDAAGRQWLLPQPTAWRMEYTAGMPCDSFWMRCLWEAGSGTRPGDWPRFWAEHEGERVFTGVVDECQVEQSGGGSVLELSGRGMAALLLDNEALGEDYGAATMEDILRDHVRPYGIQTAAGANLPPVSPFSVATGSSEWSVVYDFARYYGGVAPRFDREGRLVLTGWPKGETRLIGDGTAVTELVYRDRRYGVLSQVLVRNRYSGQAETVTDGEFSAQGGMARRVMTMPGRSNFQAMRYTGRFQLERAKGERIRLEVEIGEAFSAWPGELVRVQRSGWDRNGLYRVTQSTVGMDGRGYWTRLELAPPDFVV